MVALAFSLREVPLYDQEGIHRVTKMTTLFSADLRMPGSYSHA